MTATTNQTASVITRLAYMSQSYPDRTGVWAVDIPFYR
jgi:hypothetical protein